MKSSASSSAGTRPRRKPASTSPSLASPGLAQPAATVPMGNLPLVPCPCCGVRRTIRLVSQSSANPGRVFYKCPNHRVGPNPCNHYYWEDGKDSYVDFLIANGYTVDGIEEKGEENVNAGLQMMDGVMQKMDELIKLCKIICAGLVIVIVVLVYDVLAK
uniref:Uncharacterized protein n=1 Tax=Avena sativa TaxID=4498 RepID=A0ACD5TXJ4_AVESA